MDPQLTAKKMGATCHLPAINEVFIDIDDPKDLTFVTDGLQLINTKLMWDARITTMRPSSTVGHLHVIVTVPNRRFTNMERVALQAILGSDRKKELWGFIHTIEEKFPPTALFTYPYKDLLF